MNRWRRSRMAETAQSVLAETQLVCVEAELLLTSSL